MARIGAVVTAMVTPFAPDGSVDLDAAVALARWLVDHGSDGLVVAGTTGEASVLDDAEKLDLFRAVAEAVTVPVVANTGSNDTAHTVELTARAASCGVAAILAVTPYYNRPGQAGIAAHLRAVAAACDLPLFVYDIPVRTGRRIAPETYRRLVADTPTFVGMKDATGDPAGTARLLDLLPAGFEVYSGDDSLTLPLLAVGAVGVIGVATHWAGEVFAEMIRAYREGRPAEARDANRRLLASYAFETGDAAPNPIPAKAMMRVLGHPVGQCRLPLGPAPDGLESEARKVLENLG